MGTQSLTIPVLNADECLLIAKNAYWDENYYYAAVWCEAAWKLVQNGDQSADSVEILDYFSIAISRLGELKTETKEKFLSKSSFDLFFLSQSI